MRHWIFDLDGTLVDTDQTLVRSLVYALEPFSVEVGDSFPEQVRHKHPYRIFEGLLDDFEALVALERFQQKGRELSQQVETFEGIKDILSHLQKEKLSLSVWTGRDEHSTRGILDQTGLAPFFKEVISGTCVPNNKPGPDGLLELQKRTKAQAQDMVMVGDHPHDIEPANTMGLTSIHAQWKSKPHELPPNLKPHFSFQSMEDFHRWVLSQL